LPSWTEAEVPSRIPLVINSLELGRSADAGELPHDAADSLRH